MKRSRVGPSAAASEPRRVARGCGRGGTRGRENAAPCSCRSDQCHHRSGRARRRARRALRQPRRRGRRRCPGFEAFELLRPTDGRDVFYVYTRWRSTEDFENWLNSQAFQHGHRAAQHAGPGRDGSDVLAFDVVQEERGVTATDPIARAHRPGRSVRDRRRGRRRPPDAGLQAAHAIAARADGAERRARRRRLRRAGRPALHVRRARPCGARSSRGRWPGSASSAAIASRSCSANVPEWVVTFWACAILGAILVPLNAWWKAEELEFGLTDSEAKVLIGDARRLDVAARPARRRCATLEHVFEIGTPEFDALLDGRRSRAAARRRSTRTTCSRSSTRRARPASRRARRSRTAR